MRVRLLVVVAVVALLAATQVSSSTTSTSSSLATRLLTQEEKKPTSIIPRNERKEGSEEGSEESSGEESSGEASNARRNRTAAVDDAAVKGTDEGSIAQLSLVASDGQNSGLRLGGADHDVWEVSATQERFEFAFNSDALMTVDHEGNARAHVDVLQVSSLQADHLELSGQAQYRLIMLDTFAAQKPRQLGWNTRTVWKCQGLDIALLPDETGAVLKKHIEDIPEHKFVRVVATVHFIDDFQGETCFLNADGRTVWSDSHRTQLQSADLKNLCGDDAFKEEKFTSALDATFPHTASTLQLEFGSNIQEAATAHKHFGVSSVQLYIK